MKNTLHCGDCMTILPTLEAQSVDAIITDLPYGTTACKWDEVIPFAPMWEQVRRLLKPRGVFVTTASQPFTSALVMSNTEWFRYEWIWRKTMGTNPLVLKFQPFKTHESVLIFSRDGHTYNAQMERGAPYSDKARPYNLHATAGAGIKQPIFNNGTRYPSSVQTFANPNNDNVHPTQKPVALYAYLIRTYTNPGDTVLDFCMGSGTTGVAAIKENRRFVGIEKDAGYYAIAQRRIEDAAAQPMLLEVT